MKLNRYITPAAAAALALPYLAQGAIPASGKLENVARNGNKPRNVIFILSDDHRYDFFGFTGAVPWLQTPSLDALARGGAHLKNAFVTTSLSSPSRASILTSLYTHEHTVVDNQAPQPAGLVFFPQYLQQAGYKTAFFGKWHMGADDSAPRPGFDQWEGFRGQGTYYNVMLNINGKETHFDPKLYSNDILTDHAKNFIKANEKTPFFVYLSFKSVHSPFEPSPRRKDMYKDKPVPNPPSFMIPHYGIPVLPTVGQGDGGKPLMGREWYGPERMPDWLKNQRESWHGVDYLYHGARPYDEDFRTYCETVTSLDDNIGDLMAFLKSEGLDKSTLIIYMGDNGFQWGEHGIIDKRTFYEASVRVPMLAYCPELIKPGTVVDKMIYNVDIGPTVMDAAGIDKASNMRGMSFLPLVEGKNVPGWRDKLYYEYYWEYDFPMTPTIFGIRTDRYKYIRYYGIWDTNEFYDLQTDPYEMNNIIDKPELQPLIEKMANELYDWLERTGGMQIPLKRTVKHRDGDYRNMNVF